MFVYCNIYTVNCQSFLQLISIFLEFVQVITSVNYCVIQETPQRNIYPIIQGQVSIFIFLHWLIWNSYIFSKKINSNSDFVTM